MSRIKSLIDLLKSSIGPKFSKLPRLGLLSSIPCNWIDLIEKDRKNGVLNYLFAAVKKRIIFISLFPLLSALDILSCSLKLISLIIPYWFDKNKEQKKILNTQILKTSQMLMDSILGLIFSPFGIILFPELISDRYTNHENNDQTVKSGGKLHSADVEIKKPKTINELVELIRSANDPLTGFKIIPKGSGMSQGQQFLPTETKKGLRKSVIVDLSDLAAEIYDSAKVKCDDQINITYTYNDKNEVVGGIATIGAGIKWAQLQTRANNCGLSLKVSQASNIFTPGGSIGTNIHGWDHRSGTIGNIVKSLTVVTPSGELVETKPGEKLFSHVLGGFGLFGIIVKAEIELTTNIEIIEEATYVPLDKYVDYFKNTVQASGDNTRMHFYRLNTGSKNMLSDGHAVSYIKDKHTGMSHPGFTAKYIHEAHSGHRFERVMIHLFRHSAFMRDIFSWYKTKKEINSSGKKTTQNSVMHPNINMIHCNSVSHADWLQEYFIPEENLLEFLAQLRNILLKNDVKLINATIRHIEKDQHAAMSYASDRPKFAVVLYFNQSLRAEEVEKTHNWYHEVYTVLHRLGGKFYTCYQDIATPEEYKQSYPEVTEVRKAKEQADPNNILCSGFYQKYIRTASENTSPVERFNPAHEAKENGRLTRIAPQRTA